MVKFVCLQSIFVAVLLYGRLLAICNSIDEGERVDHLIAALVSLGLTVIAIAFSIVHGLTLFRL